LGFIKEGPMVLARLGRCACLIVLLGLIPASVLGQGASTATIAGVVRDPSGAVLPGVTVEAASSALIEKVRSTITDERGQYRLAELRPGMYTVTFALAGFSTLQRDGLELRTSFTAQVDVELKVSQLQETINRGTNLAIENTVPPYVSLSLGSALFRSGRLTDAEREYKAAIAADPKSGEAFSNLAVVYLETGRIDEADKAVKAAERVGFKVHPGLKDDISKRKKGL
jgi:predicted Zn-dependent protease